MVYRVQDLMGFGLVGYGEQREAVTCTMCGTIVVFVDRAGQADLATILDPCVEHRRGCPGQQVTVP